MLSRAFVVLFIAMFVAMAGVGMVSPLLPVYVRDDLGGPAIGVALSFSGLAIAQIISAPFAGSLGDRHGLKPFIVGGFAIYAVGAFGYLFATTWEQVVFFRLLSGFGAAGVFPMTLAYVGRLAPAGREGSFMGAFTVAQVTGFGLGPLLGGGIRDAFSSEAAFATMGIMLAGTAFLTLLWLPAHAGSAASDGVEAPSLPWSEIVRRRAVQGAVLFMTLMSIGWGAAYSFLAIYIVSEEGLGLDSALFVGLLLSLRQFTNAALQPITGRLADRWDSVKLVAAGLVFMSVGTLLIPIVPATVVEVGPVPLAVYLLLAVIVAGIGESLAMPAQQAVFVTLGRVVGMGSLMGLNNMGNSVGFLFGSLAGAAVVGSLGLPAVFVFAAAILFAGTILYVLIMASAKRELERAAEFARLAEEREARAALEASGSADAVSDASTEVAV